MAIYPSVPEWESLEVCLRISPFDAPLSIKELALRPRIALLLRRVPFTLDFRISLLRWMTGVSANGSAILVAPRFFSIRNSALFGVLATGCCGSAQATLSVF